MSEEPVKYVGVINLASLPEILTVAEVAAYLRLNRQTVMSTLILTKRLGAQKVGNQWRISRAALEEFLGKEARPSA